MYAQLLKNDKQFDEAAAVFQAIGDHSQAGQCLRKAHRFEEAVSELEALPSMSERDYYNEDLEYRVDQKASNSMKNSFSNSNAIPSSTHHRLL